MGRKGKTQKHTAKEINGKHAAAKAAAGGVGLGGAGKALRSAQMAKIQVKCKICMSIQPHIAGMRSHYEGKHSKEKWEDSMYAGEFNEVKSAVKKKEKTIKTIGREKAGVTVPGGKKSKKKNDLSELEALGF